MCNPGLCNWSTLPNSLGDFSGLGKTKYRNDPKFPDRLVWANSADPDQTAPRGAV